MVNRRIVGARGVEMMPKSNTPATGEITPEKLYFRRREFIRNSLLFTVTGTSLGGTLLWLMKGLRAEGNKTASSGAALAAPAEDSSLLTISRRYDYASGEPETPFQSLTTYNNFYEFATHKPDPP